MRLLRIVVRTPPFSAAIPFPGLLAMSSLPFASLQTFALIIPVFVTIMALKSARRGRHRHITALDERNRRLLGEFANVVHNSCAYFRDNKAPVPKTSLLHKILFFGPNS